MAGIGITGVGNVSWNLRTGRISPSSSKFVSIPNLGSSSAPILSKRFF